MKNVLFIVALIFLLCFGLFAHVKQRETGPYYVKGKTDRIYKVNLKTEQTFWFRFAIFRSVEIIEWNPNHDKL